MPWIVLLLIFNFSCVTHPILNQINPNDLKYLKITLQQATPHPQSDEKIYKETMNWGNKTISVTRDANIAYFENYLSRGLLNEIKPLIAKTNQNKDSADIKIIPRIEKLNISEIDSDFKWSHKFSITFTIILDFYNINNNEQLINRITLTDTAQAEELEMPTLPFYFGTTPPTQKEVDRYQLMANKWASKKAAIDTCYWKILDRKLPIIGRKIFNNPKIVEMERSLKGVKTAPSYLLTSVKFLDDESLLPNQSIDAAEESRIITTIKNTGQGTAFDVKLNIETGDKHLKVPALLEAGDIGPGASQKITIPVKAGRDLADGTAKFLITAQEKRGYSAQPVQLKISTAAMQRPKLMIADCKVNDASGLARGDGDMTAENNETIALEPFIQNTGVGEALQVSVKLSDITEGLELVQADTRLAAISPNTTGKAALAFHIPRTFDGREIQYTIAATDTRGITTEKTFTVPFHPQAPDLYMAYQVLDENGEQVPNLENGRSYRLHITPENKGNNLASQVRLEVDADSSSVSLGSFNRQIGRLDPGEVASPVIVPLSLHRSYQNAALNLSVALSQSDFAGLSKEIKLPVVARKPRLDYRVTLMNGLSETAFARNSRPRFRVSVSNNGDLPATEVAVDFVVNHPDIDYQLKKTIGTIQPGQSQYADFQFFVRADADTGKLPIDVTIAQADFEGRHPQKQFALKKQQAIQQTVAASGTHTSGGGFYAGAPELYINTPQNNSETMEKVVSLHGSIISYGKGNAIDRFDVKLNGRSLKTVSGRSNAPTTQQIAYAHRADNKLVFDGKIQLQPGENTLLIQGIDRNNQPCRQTLTITKKARLGDIYALVVGISRFANAGYNLDYATSDAEKFYRFLQSDVGGGLNADRVRLLTDEQATRARIIKEMTRFLGRAGQDDTVQLYLATHGLTGSDGTLYYLCHNTETDNLPGTGFSDKDLTEIISHNIEAGKLILYLDACHSGLSGLSGQRYARRGIGVHEVNEKINNLAVGLSKVGQTGVATFSATSASGYSLEGKDWQGGVFTHCLVSGLRGKANTDNDEWVTIKEIDNYLTDNIRSLTNGEQKPRLNCTLPADKTPLAKVK